ncbi:MAG: hypothetical protein WC657_00945 [Candidatus Paceibacterota bacterium]
MNKFKILEKIKSNSPKKKAVKIEMITTTIEKTIDCFLVGQLT